MAGDERADQGAGAEDDPVAAAAREAVAEAAGDEVDKKDHVRHLPGRDQGVFDVKGAERTGGVGRLVRPGGRGASTVGAARAIAAPPAIPLIKRQTKYHAKPSGKAQARRLATVRAIAPRSVVAGPIARPTCRAVSAPARYPARFAAPRYTAVDGLNHPAAINAGIRGV